MDQNQPINSQPADHGVTPEAPESQNRRELVTKLGKYAIYAAPFTVMALNSQAASEFGP